MSAGSQWSVWMSVFGTPRIESLTLGQQEDIVKQLVGLRRRLQQRHQHSRLPQVDKVPDAADDLKGVAAVQPRADLQGPASSQPATESQTADAGTGAPGAKAISSGLHSLADWQQALN